MMRKKISYILVVVLLGALPLSAGYLEQGKAYYMHKNYAKAREALRKAAETTDHGDAYYFLGEVEKLDGNYAAAEENLKICVTKKTTTRKYMRNAFWDILLLQEQRGDVDAVIKTCREMYQRLGDSSAKSKIESLINKRLWTDNGEAVAEYNAGVRLRDSGNTAEAEKRFRNALGIDPQFLAPQFDLGMIAYREGRLDEALSHLSPVASAIAFYAEVHVVMGDILYRKGQHAAAISHFDKAFEFGFIDKSTEFLLRSKRAECHYNLKDYDRAAADLERCLTLNKDALNPYLLLSAIRIKLDDLDAALKILQRVPGKNAKHPQVLYQTGSIYYKKNDRKYVQVFTSLFEAVKKRQPEKYARAFALLASYHCEQKNYKKASEVLAVLPDSAYDSELHLAAGRTAFHLQDYGKAASHFEKAQLTGPDKILLAKCYIRTGQANRAAGALSGLSADRASWDRAKNDSELSEIIRKLEQGAR